MAKKKYDPLWEIIDEKVALQGVEPDIDALCPYCSVTVHIAGSLADEGLVECGLCGSLSTVARAGGGVTLKPVE